MTVTHQQHQKDYDAGYTAVMEDIRTFGLDRAADKWRAENPTDHKPSSLGAYYYAKGGLDALVA